eukprot:s2741_g7.t2
MPSPRLEAARHAEAGKAGEAARAEAEAKAAAEAAAAAKAAEEATARAEQVQKGLHNAMAALSAAMENASLVEALHPEYSDGLEETLTVAQGLLDEAMAAGLSVEEGRVMWEESRFTSDNGCCLLIGGCSAVERLRIFRRAKVYVLGRRVLSSKYRRPATLWFRVARQETRQGQGKGGPDKRPGSRCPGLYGLTGARQRPPSDRGRAVVATRGGRRIPRKHLLVLLLLGPFLATVAMVLLHHKVRKRRFLIGSVVGGALRVGMAVAWIELLHFDAGLLAYTSVAGGAWLAALLLQARRGCHCEPSTDHGPGVWVGSLLVLVAQAQSLWAAPERGRPCVSEDLAFLYHFGLRPQPQPKRGETLHSGASLR